MNKTTEILLIIFFVVLLAGAVVYLLKSQYSPIKKSAQESTVSITATALESQTCQKKDSTATLDLAEAKTIAEASSCVADGKLTAEAVCNDITGTWWIDLDIKKEGCNPACVVNVETKQAEINWRCTGLK